MFCQGITVLQRHCSVYENCSGSCELPLYKGTVLIDGYLYVTLFVYRCSFCIAVIYLKLKVLFKVLTLYFTGKVLIASFELSRKLPKLNSAFWF